MDRRSSKPPTAKRPARRPKGLRKSKTAFTCRECGEGIGDPLYTSTPGHGREGVCFECHLAVDLYGPRWRRRSARGIAPERRDIAWLLHQGYTRAEIAAAIGLHRNTVAERIERLKRFPRLLGRVMDLLGMRG